MFGMVLPGCLGSSCAELTRGAFGNEAVEIIAAVQIDAATTTRRTKKSFHFERADR
jgi:hypothetical protein